MSSAGSISHAAERIRYGLYHPRGLDQRRRRIIEIDHMITSSQLILLLKEYHTRFAGASQNESYYARSNTTNKEVSQYAE